MAVASRKMPRAQNTVRPNHIGAAPASSHVTGFCQRNADVGRAPTASAMRPKTMRGMTFQTPRHLRMTRDAHAEREDDGDARQQKYCLTPAHMRHANRIAAAGYTSMNSKGSAEALPLRQIVL